MTTSKQDKIWTALNTTILIVIAYLLFRPNGPARSQIDAWRTERREARNVVRMWPTVWPGASRYTGTDSLAPDVVVFTDYECPFCKQLDDSIEELLGRHPQASIGYRHYPLSIHANALPAAKAAVCAEKQGQFHKMHRHLFVETHWRKEPDWRAEASHVGIPNVEAFMACLEDSTTAARIAFDRQLGDSLAVSGTPAVVTATKKYQSSLSTNELEPLVQ